MAFGKKTNTAAFDPRDAYTLASKALRERRMTQARLAFRMTLDETLMNCFSNKALLQMLGKQTGLDQLREQKDLLKAFEDSKYRNSNDDVVLPCRIIKAAIVEGAISTGKFVTKAELKRDLRVVGHTSPIIFPKGHKAEPDVRLVRNQTGVPDVRSRALLPAGSQVECVLQFPTTLSPDKVIAAFDGAGSSIGVCDYRPQNGGIYGTFSVELLPEAEVERIIAACALPEKPFVIPPQFMRAFNSLGDGDGASKPSDAHAKAVAVVKHVNGQAKRSKRSEAAV